MVEVISVLDLFNREDYRSNRIIVVKNLPDKTHLDTIQNYLEVVTQKGLQSVCTRSGLGQTNVLVAVLDEAIKDINEIHHRLFEERSIHFEYLGDVSGILVIDVGTVPEQTIGLYFENPRRSGGKEGAVQGVEIHTTQETRAAVIQIDDSEAISGILSRPDHKICGQTFVIEPYFPKLHDYLLEHIKNANQRQKGKINDSRSTILTDVTQLAAEATSNSESPEVFKDFVAVGAMKTTENVQSKPIFNPPVLQKEVDSILVSAPLDKQLQLPAPSSEKIIIPSSTSNNNKLRVIIDDHEETPTDTDLSLKDKQDHIAGLSADNNSQAKGRWTTHARFSNQETLSSEEQIQQTVVNLQNINLTKVILLKIGGINRQCKSKNMSVDISLQERPPSVILKGIDRNELSIVEDRIHEMLSCVKQKSVKVSPKEKGYYLGRPTIKDFLRKKSREEKVPVAFEMNVENMELTLYAYHFKAIETGLQLLNQSFTKETISLTKAQVQVLHSQEWHDFKDEQNSKFTILYEIDEKIIIESTLMKENIADIRKAVIDFFQSFIPRHKSVMELNGGQAKYFQTYIQKDLEEFIRNKEARVSVEKKDHGGPMKLILTVEGQASCTEEVTKRIKQIWHEKIDFDKLHLADGDVWLIMQSMDGEIGRRFFRQFQLETKCVIEVVREGDIQPPPLRIKQKRQSQDMTPIYSRKPIIETKSDSSDDTEDELEVFKQNQMNFISESDNTESDDTEGTSTISSESDSSRLQNIFLYQGRMNEHAALAEAKKMSLIDSPNRHFRQHPKYSATYIDESRKRIEINIRQTRVVLIQRKITEEKADALVNIVDPSDEFPGQSVVARAFVKKGGPQLVQNYEDVQGTAAYHSDTVSHNIHNLAILRSPTPFKYIIVTQSAGNLQCRDVIHVKLTKRNPQVAEVLTEVMKEVYHVCSIRKYNVISLPPLGIGRLYKYPEQQVASIMVKATKMCLMEGITQIQEVRFVVYKNDKETFRIFQREFDQLNRPSMAHYQDLAIVSNNYPRYMRTDQPHAAPAFSATHHIGHSSPDLKLMNPTPKYTGTIQSEAEGRQPTSQRSRNIQKGNFNQGLPRRTYSSGALGSHGQIQEERMMGRFPRQQQGFRKYYKEETERQTRTRSTSQERRTGQKPQYRNSGKHTSVMKEDRPKLKPRKPPTRFQKESASPKLTVTVFAGDRDICKKSHHTLEKKIQEEFLYEISLEKRPSVSDEAKQKIARVIQRYKLKSVKGNLSNIGHKNYRLRGYRENVHKANEEILQVLLNDKPDNPSAERQRRRSTQPRRTPEFTKVMAVDEPEVPRYWKNFHPGETLKNLFVDLKQLMTNRKYEKVKLKDDEPTYKAIVRFINKTLDADKDNIGHGKDAHGIHPYRQCFVLRIYRIENPELYSLYATKRSEIFRKLYMKELGFFPKVENVKIGQQTKDLQAIQSVCLNHDRELEKDVYDEVNEYYFFHGTKKENIDKICSDGLDSRLCSPDAMFGQGIYGAESVVKADQYTDDKSDRSAGEKKMFLMRMLLGDIYVCPSNNSHKFKRAPCTSCYMDNCTNKNHSYHFDSVIGGMNKLFREFVVYESKQCYPEYLITYERR